MGKKGKMMEGRKGQRKKHRGKWGPRNTPSGREGKGVKNVWAVHGGKKTGRDRN